MKRHLIQVLTIIITLSLSTLAHSALVEVPIVDSDFSNNSSQWTSSSTYQGNQVWYHSSTWSDKATQKYAGFGAAGNNTTGSLFQVISFNGGAGEMDLSFSTRYVNSSPSANVSVYGSNIAIASDTTNFGTLLLSMNFSADSTSWSTKTCTGNADSSYSWYTIVFNATTTRGSNATLGIDNVSLQVNRSPVPLPNAASLLGAGLIGLIGARRRLLV